MIGAGHRALAWMPWTGDVRRSEAAAVEWTSARCEAEGRPGVLLAEDEPTDGPLAWFAARYQGTTAVEVGTTRPRSVRRGPVLAHRPTLAWLPGALTVARRSSLCVLDGPDSLVAGWAMAAGATDLSTGQTARDTRTREQQSFHALLLYAGGRQWGDDYGRAAAPTQLHHLALTGLPLETTLGVMLANGATAAGLENLRAIALR